MEAKTGVVTSISKLNCIFKRKLNMWMFQKVKFYDVQLLLFNFTIFII